jgi:hypothetical protein
VGRLCAVPCPLPVSVACTLMYNLGLVLMQGRQPNGHPAKKAGMSLCL